MIDEEGSKSSRLNTTTNCSYFVQSSCLRENAHLFPQVHDFSNIVMKVADGGIRPLSGVDRLVYKKVHLLGYPLAHYAKNATFPRGFKVNRPGLHRIAGHMHLLCVVKRIVHRTSKRRSGTAFTV